MPAHRVECSYETGASRGAMPDVPAQVRLDKQATWLLTTNTRLFSMCTGR
ncbi:UNVERIFIED_ORG: hypothetical protein J2Y81_007770 [Paraburkholderia sediminicola]|nr:hypothetical protein [Paraburkholderia sediminicola]